jgi:hypothetical protein
MKRTLVFPGNPGGDADPFPAARARGDELWDGARWVLEREAEAGMLVWQDPPIYVLAMEAGPTRMGADQGPRLSVFYTIAYDRVLVLSLAEGGPSLPNPP